MRNRVLVVNAFFDEYRRSSGSPYRIPSAMGPVHLAGAFNQAAVEVRLYNENIVVRCSIHRCSAGPIFWCSPGSPIRSTACCT